MGTNTSPGGYFPLQKTVEKISKVAAQCRRDMAPWEHSRRVASPASKSQGKELTNKTRSSRMTVSIPREQRNWVQENLGALNEEEINSVNFKLKISGRK